MPPKTIGHYKLFELLGRGSFGTVWEAQHVVLGRAAAVKVLDRMPDEGRQAERFLREAQIAGNLQHPNIVTLLESGHAELDEVERPFLAYELIEGVTLSEWCQFTQITPREKAELVAQLASAVHYAHTRDVVHRDLKPANILVDLSGQPHVTDFGLARRLDDRLTEQNVTLGTIAYMSPEQAAGNSAYVGPASDIFSLGVILCELLTGELPFRNSSIASYISNVAEREPVIQRVSGKQLPGDLVTICLKCLAKKPADRYESAHALEQDLLRFVEGRPITARSSE